MAHTWTCPACRAAAAGTLQPGLLLSPYAYALRRHGSWALPLRPTFHASRRRTRCVLRASNEGFFTVRRAGFSRITPLDTAAQTWTSKKDTIAPARTYGTALLPLPRMPVCRACWAPADHLRCRRRSASQTPGTFLPAPVRCWRTRLRLRRTSHSPTHRARRHRRRLAHTLAARVCAAATRHRATWAFAGACRTATLRLLRSTCRARPYTCHFSHCERLPHTLPLGTA